jgi:flavin-dependent dehydrogenase
MNYKLLRTKVLIAGGGPAGAATALSLNARGIPCIVAEAAEERKFKAGETIPPNALPLLQKMNINSLLDDELHLKSYGNRFLWGEDTVEDKTFFSSGHPNGWHLDRMHFEGQLENAVKITGTQWLTGTRIADYDYNGKDWKVTLKGAGGGLLHCNCEFIVDATGRASRIARSLGNQRQKTDNLCGLTVCYETTGINCPHYTFVESVAGGWWYAAPLSGSRLVITFMTDSDLADPGMMEAGHFKNKLLRTDMTGDIFKNHIISSETKPFLQTANTSWLPERYGKSWLAAGDAAIAYDPLSSYGITSALQSGFYAGHAIADYLNGTQDALIAYDWLMCEAFDAYKNMHMHQYQLEKRWENEPFWKRRRD